MTDITVSGNIFSSKNRNHAGKLHCGSNVDRKDFCPCIFAENVFPVEHAFKMKIIGVLCLPQSFHFGVNPHGAFADSTGLFDFGNRQIFPEHFSCQQNRFIDFRISRAAANIIPNGCSDIIGCRVRIVICQILPANDHSGDTKTALNSTDRRKRIGKYIPFALGKAFDRLNFFPIQFGKFLCARTVCLTIDNHGTGTAGTFVTAIFYGCDSHHIP